MIFAARPDVHVPRTLVCADLDEDGTPDRVWVRHAHDADWVFIDDEIGGHLEAGLLMDPTAFDIIDEEHARKVVHAWGGNWTDPSGGQA